MKNAHAVVLEQLGLSIAPAEIRRIADAKLEAFARVHPQGRLARAVDAIRNGKHVLEADREYIAGVLEAELDRERASGRDHRALIADEIANKARIKRELAAAFVVRDSGEIPAVVRAIGRLRNRKHARKKDTRR